MHLARVDVYSHNAVFSRMTAEVKKVVMAYCRYQLMHSSSMQTHAGDTKQLDSKMFAASTHNRAEIRVHINCYEYVLNDLKQSGISISKLDIVTHDLYETEDIVLGGNKSFVPRPDQVNLVDYVITGYENPDRRTSVLDMAPGKGKTLTTFFALDKINKRVVIVIPPKYIERWIGDMTNSDKFLNLKPGKDIYVVRGTKPFCDLIQGGLDDTITAKIIVLSNQTLYAYYKHYESYDGDMRLYQGVRPEDLWKVLKVGIKVTDEVHENFHLNFRTDLYTHIPYCIGLSASLEPDDNFLERMYHILFPLDIRRNTGEFDKHVIVKAIRYGIGYNPPGKKQIKWNNKVFKSYSHTSFENTLMKNAEKLDNYLKLIKKIVDTEYIDKRWEGSRILLFASTVKMCTLITDYLKEMYPDLKVSKYTQEEDYDVLENFDVIVSTPGSAGTAVDISELISAVNTVAVSSKQANIQNFGRLRPVFLPDSTLYHPSYCYLVCENIPKHLRYHEKRKEIFEKRSFKQLDQNSGFSL